MGPAILSRGKAQTCRNTMYSSHLSRNRTASVNNDCLTGHEGARLRGEENCGACDLVRLTDAAERCARGGEFQDLWVVPKRRGELGLDQSGRDAVGAHVLRPVFDRYVARQLEIGRLRDAVGAEHR